ncbi:hypothetical protein M378DRAFT_87153, partial [Amanita muscaria Koide BX008]
MSNDNGLDEDGITDEQLQEKIPEQLCYASVYWVNHFEASNIEGSELMNGLEKFVDEHTLHWFEVLSLIGNLDLAHRAIRAVIKLLKSTSSYLHQLLSDALRFISKFYRIINPSALHTYYSALPFSPTDSLLYRRYIKEARHNLCGIEGGPEKWDAVVAILSHGEWCNSVSAVEFGPDGRLFASELNDETIKMWNAGDGSLHGTLIASETTKVIAMALSRDCSRLAVARGFWDGTVELWETSPTKRRIASHKCDSVSAVGFGPDGRLFASGSFDGTIKLWN